MNTHPFTAADLTLLREFAQLGVEAAEREAHGCHVRRDTEGERRAKRRLRRCEALAGRLGQ